MRITVLQVLVVIFKTSVKLQDPSTVVYNLAVLTYCDASTTHRSTPLHGSSRNEERQSTKVERINMPRGHSDEAEYPI